MKLSQIPKLFKPLYKTLTNGFLAVMNPYSYHGFLILDAQGANIFNQIDGKKQLQHIYSCIKPKYNTSITAFEKLIDQLIKYRLVTFHPEKNVAYSKLHAPGYHQEKILTFWFSVTNQCNFRCSYCFVSKTPEKMDKRILKISLMKIFLSAKKYGFDKIHILITGGEPLLEIDLVKKIKSLIPPLENKYHLPTIIGIISNASLITEKNASYLKRNGIKVATSIDGIDEGQNATRMYHNGKGTYKQVIKGIMIAKKYGILDAINITVTSKNIHQLPEFVDFLLNNVSNEISFGLFKNNHLTSNVLSADQKDLISNFKKVLDIIYSYFRKKNVFISPMVASLVNIDYVIRSFPTFPVSSICSAGSSYISLTHRGEISLCPYEAPIKGYSVFSDKDMLKTYWEAAKIHYHKSGAEFHPECNKCIWKYICAGGCKFQRKYMHSDFVYKSPYCEFYKKIIPYFLKLEAKRITYNLMSGI